MKRVIIIMLIEQNIENLNIHTKWHWISEPTGKQKMIFLGKTDKGEEVFRNEVGEVIAFQDVFDSNYECNYNKRQIIFIIGITSVKEINELIRKENQRSIFIIIEPNMDLFSYTLHHKKLNMFKKESVILFNDENWQNLNEFLQNFFQIIHHIAYAKNVKIYLTSYYRQFEVNTAKSIAETLRKVITSAVRMYGNDPEDSLIGLRQNLENLKWVLQSKDITKLKDRYSGKPAIVVAAGPSLNKNIHYLHELKGKAVIIAVDTIAARLIKDGIIPDFICSVERVTETYDYFYQDKNYPKEMTLVGPPLLDKRVFEEFPGNMLLAMRAGVGEYFWLGSLLELNDDSLIMMGHSCAHVAFGMAVQLGCAPIILIGQDLAYGKNEKETHASGTLYDKKNMIKMEIMYTEGYYGGQVATTSTWLMFKYWYEAEIGKHNLQVINATEGGAKIENTISMGLKEAIDKYCVNDIENIKEVVNQLPTYQIDKAKLLSKLQKEVQLFKDLIKMSKQYMDFLDNLNIDKQIFLKKSGFIIKQLEKYDEYVSQLYQHPLCVHNMQAMIIKTQWDLIAVEEVVSVENLLKKRDIQTKMVISVISISEQILQAIQNAITILENQKGQEVKL